MIVVGTVLLHPVGTGGGRGDGRGPCACPSWQYDTWGFARQTERTPDEDRHKAPTATRPFPLPLQMGSDVEIPTRIAKEKYVIGTQQTQRRYVSDQIAQTIFFVCAALLIVVIICIFLFVGANALRVFF